MHASSFVRGMSLQPSQEAFSCCMALPAVHFQPSLGKHSIRRIVERLELVAPHMFSITGLGLN